ncbi:glycosyltransferase family protein [uncultured Pseudodesulfovibrio sp.]|uniref:glycosyltransferase family protein n=1 Tax=uncultured Pseudodesulfovibrio sp. TaxID=2035858 RepID=UPI0029C7DC9C|nr:glycosyltransferase family protein [uncultured Pseudodesulfovibrio sp.]
MARILYGVMGDAGGHINRSLAVAAELPEHDFLFVGGGKVEEALSRGHDYEPLPMLSTVLKDSKVLMAETALHFGKTITGYGKIIDGLCGTIDSFKPDLAITDYEFFLPRAARKYGLECVSLDHQHVLTHCDYPTPPGERLSRFFTVASARRLFSRVDKFLVSSFYALPPKDDSTEVFPPIMHRDIEDFTSSEKDHVVVYMRSGVSPSLLEGMRFSNRDFQVYGLGAQSAQGNLQFLPSSREGFLENLASAAYVICNGGHTLTCEALHLGKPVLAFPTSFFYEQYFNAVYLEKLGYGRMGMEDCRESIVRFEQALEQCRARLAGIDLFGNGQVAERINRLLASG